MKLIDYILKTQNSPKGKIIEDYCPSDFGMDKYNDCDDRWGCEDDNCGKCWNKELNPKDIPHTCDTCRRYGKSDHNCYYCRHKERPDLWEAREDIHE